MARKKKSTQTSTVSTINDSAIKYNGKVTVTLKSGKTTISTNTYKNNGSVKLWQFLCFCLAGNWSEALPLRPLKIKLYYNSLADPDDINRLEPFNDTYNITRLITTNSKIAVTPVYEQGSTTVSSYKATLHFIIPSAYINSVDPVSPQVDPVLNQIGLFPANYFGELDPTASELASDNKNWLAYFLFKINGSWAPDLIKINSLSGNYNLIIDWQMSFTN